MTLDALLRRWTDQGRLDADRAGRIAAYRDERPLSLYWEIRALLYAGVLLIIAGVGQTIRAHFANLTDTAVIGGLAAGAALLFGYVVRRAPPFAKTAAESPASFFDAALFLACGLLSADAAYAQWRFQWMGRAWDAYLLSAAALFGWLSYRYDNRWVLSLAISSAGAWFGVKMNGWGWTESDALRRAAFLYGATLVAVGALFDRAGLKRHFTDVYFSFAAHLLQLAALSAVLARLPWTPVIFVLLALSTVAALYAARTRRWVYLIFAVVYSYIGVSAMIIRALADPGPMFLYLLLSAGGVAAAIVSLARRSPDPS